MARVGTVVVDVEADASKFVKDLDAASRDASRSLMGGLGNASKTVFNDLQSGAKAGVTAILGLAFAWQFAYDELPCPLCLLQRVAFMLAGVGLLLNLRLGPSPMHYAMTIAASLGGMVASGRQVLLHIAPGDAGYGTPFLGLHFYTWAFIAFGALIVFCVLMLSVDRKWGDNMLKRPVSVLGVVNGSM